MNPKTATIRLEAGQRPRLKLEVPALELRVLKGPDEGFSTRSSLALIRIGSDPDNDVVLRDPAVSRFHLEVLVGAEGLVLNDLGSKNGSFYQAQRFTSQELEDSGEVQLGESTLALARTTIQKSRPLPRRASKGWVVGTSPKARSFAATLSVVAKSDASVLIHGETGTGKELAAEEIHRRSGRSGDFVVLDCALADPEMIKADLFGHTAGAFTGAQRERKGAFRAAQKGTLFLDEIGELPLDLQPRLLRVLESRTVTPLGSDRPERVDVRVVAATHRNLAHMVRDEKFRADLFHRLAILPLEVPPLRERLEDLDSLIDALVDRSGLDLELSDEARKALKAHPWPGNVRELRNTLERAAVLAQSAPAKVEHLRLELALEAASSGGVSSRASLAELEREAIERALERHQGHQGKAADDLGISIATLRRRLKQYRDEEGSE